MAEQKRDYYEVLGVEKNADDAAKSVDRLDILYSFSDRLFPVLFGSGCSDRYLEF